VKQIEAYYTCWCSPPVGQGDDYATVSIQYKDDTLEEIFRMKLRRFIDRESKEECARVILAHFLGLGPSKTQIDELVVMPGHSLCRLTPEDLQPFKQGVLF